MTKTKVIAILIAASMVIGTPMTALADSASGSVQVGTTSNSSSSGTSYTQTATLTTTTKNDSTSGSSHQGSTTNGGHSGSSFNRSPDPTPITLEDIANLAVTLGQQEALQGGSSGHSQEHIGIDPGCALCTTGDKIYWNTSWTTTDSQTTTRGYTPLYWNWTFENQTSGTSQSVNQGPMKSINYTFTKPGHYKVFFNEFGKWETGWYEYKTVTVTGEYGGVKETSTVTVPIWHHTGYSEGYQGERFLLDFQIDDWQVNKSWSIPNGVGQSQLETTTVQTIAH